MHQGKVSPEDFVKSCVAIFFFFPPSEDRHGAWAAQLQSVLVALQRGTVSAHMLHSLKYDHWCIVTIHSDMFFKCYNTDSLFFIIY